MTPPKPRPFVIDMHADTPQRFLDEGWNFTAPLDGGMTNLDSARLGNVAAQFFAIWVEPAAHAGNFARRALELTDAVHEQLRKHPAALQLCLSPTDIRNAQAAGRFGVLLGLEGGHAIENSLPLLRNFYRLGVRYMTLTWNNHNDWADSSAGKPLHHGLTSFGREVIREMNRLGMMVDVSHASDETFWDVLEVSAAPVIASHSSSRALAPAARNLTDDQLRALAAKDGVAMVNFYPAFLDAAWDSAWNASHADRAAAIEAASKPFSEAGTVVPYYVSHRIDVEFASRIPRPSFESLIAQFDHMMRVAGTQHVGIGTDFDGIPALPEGIDSAADIPRIAEGLAAKGYSAEDVGNVLSGNAMRVFDAVLDCAKRLGEATSLPAV
jgi:membrane dipeptidase